MYLYNDRVVDLYISNREEDNSVDFSILGEICTGIEKTAQMFTILFLNELISFSSNLDYYDIREGFIGSNVNSNVIINYINIAISTSLSNYENTSKDLDENIRNVSIVDVTINEDKINLTLELESEAGNKVNIIEPIEEFISL